MSGKVSVRGHLRRRADRPTFREWKSRIEAAKDAEEAEHARRPRKARARDRKVKVMEFPGGLARNVITRPDGMQLIVSTIDTVARWRSPPKSQKEFGEAMSMFDQLIGAGHYETAVWVDKFEGRELPSEIFPVVVVADYPDKDLALAGHEIIVRDVKRGKLDYRDIRSGDAMVRPDMYAKWMDDPEGFRRWAENPR